MPAKDNLYDESILYNKSELIQSRRSKRTKNKLIALDNQKRRRVTK